MKNLKSILAFALMALFLTGFTSLAMAQSSSSPKDSLSKENAKLTVFQMNPMKFRVAYYAPGTEMISVRIYDMNNSLLYSENPSMKNQYVKFFDLSTIADGTYTFEVRDGSRQYKQSFDILTQTSRVASAN